MGLKAGWLAFFLFVWIIGAFLGSTFEYHNTADAAGVAYTTGTATFTNGSATVTGVGTVWVAAMEDGKIKADADGIWVKIETVVNNTELTLYAPYTGTGGAGLDYTMAASPGWAGSGTGGYAESPITTLEYIIDVTNSFQRLPFFNITIPIPTNVEYWESVYKVVTWRWSFMEDYDMLYWIVLAPFVAMGILSLILIAYGIITGNLSWT